MFANFESNFFFTNIICLLRCWLLLYFSLKKKEKKIKAKNKKQAAVAALLPCFKLVLSLLACLLANFLSLQINYALFCFFSPFLNKNKKNFLNLHSLYFFLARKNSIDSNELSCNELSCNELSCNEPSCNEYSCNENRLST